MVLRTLELLFYDQNLKKAIHNLKCIEIGENFVGWSGMESFKMEN